MANEGDGGVPGKLMKHMIRSSLSQVSLFLARKRQRLAEVGSLGRPTFVSRSVELTFHGRISIGRYCRIGPHCHLDGEGGLTIGDGTIIAPRVAILSGSHNYDQGDLLPYDDTDKLEPVEIGAGVWIGYGAILMPGATVGDGAIIAAGSVVTKPVKNGEIVAGNPAKMVSQRGIAATELEALVAEERYFLKAAWAGNTARPGRRNNGIEIIKPE